MVQSFKKYHGTGNDFIVLHGKGAQYILGKEIVELACNRHLGIGADGLMVLWPSDTVDFHLDYYNADGGLGSMCGNGSRCAVDFARSLALFVGSKCQFTAADGLHTATIDAQGFITVHFAKASFPVERANGWFLDTGSPHHIRFVKDVTLIDAMGEGRLLRYGVYAEQGGANINWLSQHQGEWHIRTYERGVEAETLSCGTGAVAAALVLHSQDLAASSVSLHAKGGTLIVSFAVGAHGYQNITLTGPAESVFEGVWSW
jgi:diaminopimelate epimerase